MSIKKLMLEDDSGSELVNYAKATAQQLVKDGLTRAQIRNIFTEVRRIEDAWGVEGSPAALRRLNLLKPKLAYQSARTRQAANLERVLIEAIDIVDRSPEEQKNERFNRFVNFFEAVLAYHRSEGGRS